MKLKVVTKKDGFRRAGFVFRENQPMIIDTETLPAEKRKEIVDALKNEPMLVVDEYFGDSLEAKDALTSDLKKANLEIEALQKQVTVSAETIKTLEDKIIDHEIDLKEKDTALEKAKADLDLTTSKFEDATKEIASLKAPAKKAGKAS